MTTPLRPTRPGARRHSRGFSVIEIMVGMVIALVGVVIMATVLINSEERNRTTSSGNDAFSSGAIMMHMLQKDLQQAGYGLNTLNLLNCDLTLPSGATVPMAPVIVNPPTSVVPAGDANTDRLLVVYGSHDGQPEGNSINNIAGSVYTVQAPTSFHQGDYVIAYPAGCASGLTLARVTAPPDAVSVTVNTPVASSTILYNMGNAPRVAGYRIRNGALQSCDYVASDCRTNSGQWVDVAGNMASLQAVYGRDTAAAGAMDGLPDVWDQTTPTSACGWARTSALRLALVARSNQYETTLDASTGQRVCDQVTATAPTWNGGTAINLSANSSWQCYRYRTFETIAPTRNVVWMGTQATC